MCATVCIACFEHLFLGRDIDLEIQMFNYNKKELHVDLCSSESYLSRFSEE